MSSTSQEITYVSAMSNKIADVSVMWCDVVQDCQCVRDVGDVHNVLKTLTLPIDILKNIASKSQSGVVTRTLDGKIIFNPNCKFASVAAHLLRLMCVIQPLTDCWKQCSSISLRGINVFRTLLTLEILRDIAQQRQSVCNVT